jgi:glycosyltransferase involved in cell wall biosynthesis
MNGLHIWIDVEDLFEYFANSKRPSGVQRLVHELAAAIRRQLGDGQVKFVRRNHPGVDFYVVPWSEVDALFAGEAEPAPPPRLSAEERPAERPSRTLLRRILYRLPLGLRLPLIRVGRAFGPLAASFGELFRAVLAVFRALVLGTLARVRRNRPDRPVSIVEAGIARGDVVAALGSPWLSPDYGDLLARMRKRHGARIVILIYDLIPVLHPEWCGQGLVQTFGLWMRATLPQADLVVAISRSTAADVERFAQEYGVALPAPVIALPVGTGFGARPPAVMTARLPQPGSYVLFVSTIEARKNHQLLVRVWRRLLREMPREEVPTLVFAGRVGWLVHDLMQQLRNSEFLGGKIRLIDTPSDGELTSLYKGCLFTLFPSLYEGWGLPVTESLSLGKPCIISNAASLPEAGGSLARYFDPENPAEATAVIRASLQDRPGLAAWQEQVEREFRPVPWDDTARALLDRLPNGEA